MAGCKVGLQHLVAKLVREGRGAFFFYSRHNDAAFLNSPVLRVVFSPPVKIVRAYFYPSRVERAKRLLSRANTCCGVNRLWALRVLCTSTLCKRGGGGVSRLWALREGQCHVPDDAYALIGVKNPETKALSHHQHGRGVYSHHELKPP